MSVVSETLQDVTLVRIPAKLKLYEQLIDAAEPLFELTGKRLDEACKEHAKNLMFYDLMFQECKTIEDSIRAKLDEIESTLYRKYNENHSRALGTRDIQAYVKGEPQYFQAYEILLEVVHIKRQLESIVEALKTLGWSLNNIVKLRIAQMESIVL